MSTIKDYSIIETDAMLDLFNICERVNNGDTDFKALRQRIYRIKSKLKPLIPIVENAFRQGERFARHDIREIETGEKNLTLDLPEYINNTIIE